MVSEALVWSTALGLRIAHSCQQSRVSINTTSGPSATCLCQSHRLGIDRQCTHSLHRNDMAYCHFELCCDCGLGCFSELLLADIRRLSVPGGAGGVLVLNNCFFYNKT